jgi:hypothetical protein
MVNRFLKWLTDFEWLTGFKRLTVKFDSIEKTQASVREPVSQISDHVLKITHQDIVKP